MFLFFNTFYEVSVGFVCVYIFYRLSLDSTGYGNGNGNVTSVQTETETAISHTDDVDSDGAVAVPVTSGIQTLQNKNTLLSTDRT